MSYWQNQCDEFHQLMLKAFNAEDWKNLAELVDQRMVLLESLLSDKAIDTEQQTEYLLWVKSFDDRLAEQIEHHKRLILAKSSQSRHAMEANRYYCSTETL